MDTLCGLFGYSRQSFYNRKDDSDFAENAIEPLIVEKAKEYRHDNPGLGCAKLYLIIKKALQNNGFKPSLDAYSRKIVGWAVGPTLETIYPLEALRTVLSSIDNRTASMLIHHSDRGCQYCSGAYVKELKKRNISISMTQSGDPLENAIAERANGILKTEWLYKMKIESVLDCEKEMRRIITFYNTERPHRSIGMQNPDVVHLQVGPQKNVGEIHGIQDQTNWNRFSWPSALPENRKAKLSMDSLAIVHFQYSAKTYCRQVAPQQSLLPLRLLIAKL